MRFLSVLVRENPSYLLKEVVLLRRGIISINCAVFSLSSSSVCPLLKKNECDSASFAKSVTIRGPISPRVSEMIPMRLGKSYK